MFLSTSRKGRGQSLSTATAARPISVATARSVAAKGRCFRRSLSFSRMEPTKRTSLNKAPSPNLKHFRRKATIRQIEFSRLHRVETRPPDRSLH